VQLLVKLRFSVRLLVAELAEKEKLMKRAYDLGFHYEREYGSCPQCVFAAVSEIVGSNSREIFKAIDGLAGGLGRSTNGTCGALSGGIAAISHKYGRENFQNLGQREKCMALAKRLHDKFKDEYGSVICKDVQKKILGRSFNFWDPKDREAFDKAGGHTEKCPDVVGKAAKWTVDILLSEPL
jgi:C_GCAxxG_C_C family probable redox protein